MWFRRRRREPSLDLASLERSLDRLLTLVEQIVEVIPGLVPALAPTPSPPPEPVPAQVLQPVPEPVIELVPPPPPEPIAEPEPADMLLFVGDPTGYRLLEREGTPPECRAEVEVEGASYVVLRVGPSPLPGDRRRCAFLERQEAVREERTPGR